MSGRSPPRVLAWLIERLTPRGLREPVLGDLAESFARRHARAGWWAALLHYCREGVAVVGQLGAWSDEPTSLTPARPPLDGLGSDLRFAVRLHLRRPASTFLVLLTLGLGIGASTAIFSVVEPALLEPLPYPNGARLVRLSEQDRGLDGWMGYTTLTDLAREARTLDAVVAVRGWSPNLLGQGESVGLRGQRVSHEFFGMLGVTPTLGRDFGPADDTPGAQPVAIVGAGLWRDRLGADPNVLGQSISVDGSPHEVVGVLGDDFESVLAPGAEIWTPLRYDASQPRACRSCRHLVGLGRIAPGVSLAAATEEVNALVGRMAAASREDYGDGVVLVEPLKTSLIAGSRQVLVLLFGAVGLLLAVVCINVAQLLLGRALERRREFAVRMAIGSGRSRLVRQVLLESTLLGIAGSAVAVALTRLVLGAIRVAATSLPRAAAISVDWGVIRFGVVVGAATGLLFGLLPALASLRSADAGLAGALKESRQGPARRALVVVEVALAAMLVVAAGLLSQSMARLLAVDPGIRSAGVVTAQVKATGPAFDGDAAAWRYFAAVVGSVRATPGVTKAGLVSHLPLAGESDQFGVAAESRLQADPNAWASAHRLGVSPGYFETMEIPVVEGRLFDAGDHGGGAAVAVVNASYARVTFSNRSALGERIRIGGGEPAVWRTIVGVVRDVRHEGLDQPAGLQVYVPFDQWQSSDNPMWVVVRAPGAVSPLIPALHRTIRAVHPDPTIDRVEPMDAVLARALAQRTIVLRLFQAFGLLALCLAAIGGYGVMASSVAERRRELGIRAALGASAGSLRRSVIGETVALGVAGLAIGIPAAALLAFRFGSASGELDPADGGVYLAAAGVLVLAMLVAGWAPARRAARNDPAVALRSE